MSERRYSDREVAEIFERATEDQQAALPESRSSEGLTLRELQEIGRDVGLPPEAVARAARSLDALGRPQSRTLLGLPVGVGRTVELERPLTDAEWHQLVADLRETFDARGRLSEQGPFKQWTNGNLQALLEPTPTGQRLRMKTFKGSAVGTVTATLIALGVGGYLLIDELLIGALSARLPNLLVLLAIILGVIGVNAIRLPGWARLRSRQMEEIAERAALMSASDATDEPPPASSAGR